MLSRLELQQDFVGQNGWLDADLFPLPADASCRTYTRLVRSDGSSCLLMDAPPEVEKLPEFLTVQAHLKRQGLRVPDIYAADTETGLALVEDLGDNSFSTLLEAGADEHMLYRQAVDVLIHLRRNAPSSILGAAPPYDMNLMLEEVSRFLNWFVPTMRGSEVSKEERTGFLEVWRGALHLLSEDRSSFVFRDFHVDNLVGLHSRGLKGIGLLDFQDALTGSPVYDLVSLVEDARRDISPETREAVLAHYLNEFADLSVDDLMRDMAILGAQRHTKVAGLFVRFSREKEKHTYLRHLPRVLRLLRRSLDHPALTAVKAVTEQIVPAYWNAAIKPNETYVSMNSLS